MKKTIIVAAMMMSSISASAKEVNPSPTWHNSLRGIGGVFTCSVGIRNSYGTDTLVTDNKNNPIYMHTIAKDLENLAGEALVNLHPEWFTADAIEDIVAVRNTLWIGLEDSIQRKVITACFNAIQNGEI